MNRDKAMETLASRFLNRTPEWSGRIALSHTPEEVTFGQWLDASRRIAVQLRALGYERENIGLMLPGVPLYAEAFFGILLGGNTVVPINFLLQPVEAARIVRHSGMRLILTGAPLIEEANRLAAACDPRPRVVDAVSLLAGAEAFVAPETQSDDTAVLLYTSGTTGEPKGVMLTHSNLLANQDAYSQAFGFSERDGLISVLPFFHSFGITVNLLASAFCGSSLYLVPRFQLRPVLDLLREVPSGVFTAVPSMFSLLAKSPGEERLDRLRVAVSGGAPLPASIHQAFLRRFGVNITEGYGLTEASPVVCSNRPRNNRPGTIGLPLPGVEVQVWDDQDQPLPPGEPGELVTRGPHVMAGYYRNPEATAAAIHPEGWLRTGDMAIIDEAGYVRIVGRKKELIISSGMNIYPFEIEEVLTSHPKVAEAAVIGVADALRGEVPKAFVVLHEGQRIDPGELRQLCRERLAEYKIPRQIELIDALPRTPTGKIQKKSLQ
jgi:long-chain acyl-CoA synthetase